jgi:hypothetical protein
MSYFIDDVARTLAGPTPRRDALKLVGRFLAGGLFGTFAVRQASAQPAAACNPACNTTSQQCCKTGTTPFCAQQNQICCGNTSCQQQRVCCNGVCCNAGQTCLGNGRCSASNK